MVVLAVAFIIGPHWNRGFGAGGRVLHDGQGGRISPNATIQTAREKLYYLRETFKNTYVYCLLFC